MFSALFFAGLILIAAVGGKAILVMLASQPVIGPVTVWYMQNLGPIGDGLAANLIYGAMSLQLLLMALAPLLYGPLLVRKAVAWFH